MSDGAVCVSGDRKGRDRGRVDTVRGGVCVSGGGEGGRGDWYSQKTIRERGGMYVCMCTIRVRGYEGDVWEGGGRERTFCKR